MTTTYRKYIIKEKISKRSIPIMLLWLAMNSSCSSANEKPEIWHHPKMNMSMVYISGENLENAVSPFWLSTTEVTQEQWKKIMGEKELHPEKPSPFWGLHPNMPKVSISHLDAKRFIDSLNFKTGINFRLPSAVEWEFACAAGTDTDFHYGTTLSWDKANFNSSYRTPLAINGPSANRPVPVASYEPNSFGIYDMHGNAYEWTSTKDSTFKKGDEDKSKTNDFFIIKGGSWAFGAERAKVFRNISHGDSLWGHSIGFRLAADSIELNKEVLGKK